MIDWTAVAAIATAVAAGVTAAMAVETRKVAKATQTAAEASNASVDQERQQLVKLTEQTEAIISQAQLARAALTQSSLPLLLPVAAWKHPPRTNTATQDSSLSLFERSGGALRAHPEMRGAMILQTHRLDSSLWIVIEIRNIGTGLAVLTTPNLDYSRGSVGGTFFAWQWNDRLLASPGSQWLTPQEPALPPGESTYFVARLEDPDEKAWEALFGAGSELRQIQTTFTYQDLTRGYTYEMSINFGWAFKAFNDRSHDRVLLRPGTPNYKGYDRDGIDDLGSRP